MAVFVIYCHIIVQRLFLTYRWNSLQVNDRDRILKPTLTKSHTQTNPHKIALSNRPS
ncbi:MAG: hypothetical protein HC903_31755 [Methylacidiphilales bacterium]|nr:hypothetical protein [Candidatus Methylacidiphilales bacterium]